LLPLAGQLRVLAVERSAFMPESLSVLAPRLTSFSITTAEVPLQVRRLKWALGALVVPL
jgi:hypothetical protein